MFQMGGIGPMFGQLGFFAKFAGAEIEDPRPRARYMNEAKRLLAVVEKQVDGRDWIRGDYSIADMAICPWLNGLDFYGVKDARGWADHKNIVAYHRRFYERPAVDKAKNIPPRG
jgi:GST-like protein